ncbi:MAG: hypothetical protein K2G40_04415 [Muribaculaceae bacterium]|nr:hypothetical protein [Muribaculaceae bacterium]
MNNSIRILNLILLLLCITLGVLAAWVFRQPSVQEEEPPAVTSSQAVDEVSAPAEPAVTDTTTLPANTDEISTPTSQVIPEPAVKEIRTAIQNLPSTTFRMTDIRSMIADHPFASEAAKILSGNLAEDDSLSRRKILNYCEHFRSAYPSRDIDFLRQVFSNDALIIVGQTVSAEKADPALLAGDNVRYSIRTKNEYLERLSRIFQSNKKINVNFSDFHIMRHPSIEGIYGVTLRQQYESDTYSDNGYLFLLWDFRNSSMPQIHVRTWQPASTITDPDEIIGLSDFNLQ